MALEDRRDTYGIAEAVKTLRLLDYGRPLTEGFTLRVGIGEDDDLVIDQRGEEFRLEHLKAATRHPETFRTNHAHHDSGLFALYDTDDRWLMAEV